MAEEFTKKRTYVIRPVEDDDNPPRLYSTFQCKELPGRFASILGKKIRSWLLLGGHYLIVDGGSVFELYVRDDGSQELYAPDFIPKWLTTITTVSNPKEVVSC